MITRAASSPVGNRLDTSRARLAEAWHRAFVIAAALTACGGLVTVAPPADGNAAVLADATAQEATVDAWPPGRPETSAPDFDAADDASDAGLGADASTCLMVDASPYTPLPVGCSYDVVLAPSCELSTVGAAACQSLCGDAGKPTIGCGLYAADAGTVLVCHTCSYGGGRRPAGSELVACRASTPLGAYLASLAQLEAVSVPAFEILRDELKAHGAPASLVAPADEAAEDERIHARMMSALARRHGGATAVPDVVRHPVRALRDVAIENAVEGCVRETFGAMVAIVQAHRAGDRALGRAMMRIAGDEARHAELAWDVAAFCAERLDDAARLEVELAMAAELETLRRELDASPPTEVRRAAGLPSRAEASVLRDSLAAALAG